MLVLHELAVTEQGFELLSFEIELGCLNHKTTGIL